MFQPDPSGARLGPFWFSPGWSRGNAATVWLASFFTIGLAAFMSFAQPYLLNEILHIPQAAQGTLTGTLGALQEIIVICLAGFVGSWSDRVGRRRVYYLGFLLMAAGYVIYPFAETTPELILFRVLFAIGISIAPMMLSACVVDASQESSRGRWIGSNNLFQGLGVVVMATVLAKTPTWYLALGAAPAAAGRYGYWTAAGVCLVAAAAVAAGLPRIVPSRRRSGAGSLLADTRRGLRVGLGNPRLALAYGAAFIGRGDFTVIGAFFPLWILQTGLDHGLSAAASLAKGGILFGILQAAAMLSAFFMGMITDRVNRVTGLCVALALAAGGYLLLGLVDDPFARGFIPVAMLVGMGEVSVIVATGALLGQEVRTLEQRGPIIGFFNAVGGIGILFATFVGGRVFDGFGRTAPFTMMGLLNLLLLVVAIYTRVRAGQPARREIAPPAAPA